jgi:uroporphyrinogen-III decarboxylase
MVLGGVSHREALVNGEPQKLAAEVQGIKVAMGGSGWMLSPGCTFTPETPEANIRAIRQAVEAA